MTSSLLDFDSDGLMAFTLAQVKITRYSNDVRSGPNDCEAVVLASWAITIKTKPNPIYGPFPSPIKLDQPRS